MAENYNFQTTYAYATNNPIRFIDWMGMKPGEYSDEDGNIIGSDGKKDDNVHIIQDQESINKIKDNQSNGKTTKTKDVEITLTTTKTVLNETLDVYNRTEGTTEEASAVNSKGEVTQSESGEGREGYLTTAKIPIDKDDKNGTSIHSHPKIVTNEGVGWDASKPGPGDPAAFRHFKTNIIVGAIGTPQATAFGSTMPRGKGAVFFSRYATTESKPILKLSIKAIKNILSK